MEGLPSEVRPTLILACESSSSPSSLAPSIPTLKSASVSSTLNTHYQTKPKPPHTPHGCAQEPPSPSPSQQNFSVELSTTQSPRFLAVRLRFGALHSESTSCTPVNVTDVVALPPVSTPQFSSHLAAPQLVTQLASCKYRIPQARHH